MDLLGRYNSLAEKHAALEQQLESQISLPNHDESVVNALKKQKLQTKDEMQQLQMQLPDRGPDTPS